MEYILVGINDDATIRSINDSQPPGPIRETSLNDLARRGWVCKAVVQRATSKRFAILLMERQAEVVGDDEDAVTGERLAYLNDVLPKPDREF
jgi:hypothetical protein